MSIHSGSTSPKLNTGYSSSSARQRMPDRRSTPRGGSPVRHGSGPCRWRRASLFRFEGAATRPCPGEAGSRRYPTSSSLSPRAYPTTVQSAGVAARAVEPLENSRASTSIFVLQATKSQRWMPWRLKPKKDVGDCDKPRVAVYQASIRGCPNGETQHPSWGVTPT